MKNQSKNSNADDYLDSFKIQRSLFECVDGEINYQIPLSHLKLFKEKVPATVVSIRKGFAISQKFGLRLVCEWRNPKLFFQLMDAIFTSYEQIQVVRGLISSDGTLTTGIPVLDNFLPNEGFISLDDASTDFEATETEIMQLINALKGDGILEVTTLSHRTYKLAILSNPHLIIE